MVFFVQTLLLIVLQHWHTLLNLQLAMQKILQIIDAKQQCDRLMNDSLMLSSSFRHHKSNGSSMKSFCVKPCCSLKSDTHGSLKHTGAFDCEHYMLIPFMSKHVLNHTNLTVHECAKIRSFLSVCPLLTGISHRYKHLEKQSRKIHDTHTIYA